LITVTIHRQGNLPEWQFLLRSDSAIDAEAGDYFAKHDEMVDAITYWKRAGYLYGCLVDGRNPSPDNAEGYGEPYSEAPEQADLDDMYYSQFEL
jgi:hypothetical protein